MSSTYLKLFNDVGEANNLDGVKAALSTATQEQRTALLEQKNTGEYVMHGSTRIAARLNRCVFIRKDRTLLHEAAWYGNTSIASYLIEMGAKLEARAGVG